MLQSKQARSRKLSWKTHLLYCIVSKKIHQFRPAPSKSCALKKLLKGSWCQPIAAVLQRTEIWLSRTTPCPERSCPRLHKSPWCPVPAVKLWKTSDKESTSFSPTIQTYQCSLSNQFQLNLLTSNTNVFSYRCSWKGWYKGLYRPPSARQPALQWEWKNMWEGYIRWMQAIPAKCSALDLFEERRQLLSSSLVCFTPRLLWQYVCVFCIIYSICSVIV